LRLFDLSLQINGYSISDARAHLKSLQALKPYKKEQDILNRRESIVRYHITHNSFYREQLLNSYDGHWESVPIMTKAHLQRPLAERISRDFKVSQLYVNKTSGSSGDPFTFAKDKWCHAMTWAQIMDRFQWYGIDFNSSRQARFYGIPLDFMGYKKERLKDFFAQRYRFSVFDLSDMAFEKCLDKFKSSNFEYINGYTSAIVQFAKFVKRKKLILKDLCPSLKVCVVTSEMLFEQDKLLMQDAFGVSVINEYGASELDLIAFENRNNEWQVNSDTLYVEIIDANDNALPYGSEGRVVITSLFNKAHPFIRYDIGDIGTMDEASTLIKPILKSLTGRSNDLVRLPSGRTAAGLTFYYITKSIIEDDGNVKEFVIEQNKLDTFTITYSSNNPIDTHQKIKIHDAITRYLEDDLAIHFKHVSSIQRTPQGKLRQFISRLK